jgi:hypothetical protein
MKTLRILTLATLGSAFFCSGAHAGLSTGDFSSDSVLALTGTTSQEFLGLTFGLSSPMTTDGGLGYTFSGSPSDISETSFGPSYSAYDFLQGSTTGDANFDTILNNGQYSPVHFDTESFTLSGLTNGDTYNVLVLTADDRGVDARYTFGISDGASNSATPNYTFAPARETQGAYLLDTFVATRATHTFSVSAVGSPSETGGAGDSNLELSSILVGQIAAPEPGTVALLLGGLGVLAFVIRRRKTAKS